MCTSYSPNYFAIEDILATQERVPCRFLVNVPKLGMLNLESEESDLKSGTDLELPLWLVQPLSSGTRPVISADLPRFYKESYREILKADACSVELHKFGLHFYELGSYVKHLDNHGEVANILIHAFTTRFRQLMDLTNNRGSDPTFQNKLVCLEHMIFRDSYSASGKLNNWFTETGTSIEAGVMVVNHKKRKRIDIPDIF